MRQKFTIMSLCVGISFSASAQHQWLSLQPEQAKHLQVTNSLLKRGISQKNTHQKPTAIKQRVIAQVTVSEDGTDSVHYSYIGTRGSQYDYNKIAEVGYSMNFFPELSPAFIYPDESSSYDVMAETIHIFGEEGTAPETSTGYYNSSGKLDSAVATSGVNTSKFSVQYNSAGRVTQFNYESYSGSVFEGGSQRRITYAGSEVATDSTFNWIGSSWVLDVRRAYTYNSEGQMTEMEERSGTGGEGYYLYKFRYDAAGRLRASDMLAVAGSMSIPVSSDTIGYTEETEYLTFYQNIYSGDFGSYGFRVNQYPGSHAGPDSIKIDNFDEDVWVHQGTGHFTYNEFDNPEKLEVVAGDVDPEELIGMMRIHYETYDDGVSSTDDVTLKNQFGIYPNPFVDNLNIEYKGADKTRIQLQLTDISGRVIFKENKQLNAGINTLNLPQLPAGAYILVIKNELGASFAQKVIRE